MLGNGFHDVPAGKVATVVTHLEMRSQAPVRPVPPHAGIALEQVRDADPDWYRDLFTRVGGLDWLWFSRLAMDTAALTGILHDPGVELYALIREGRAEGLLELDFRVADECELAFFGVTPKLIGKGAGRFMMNAAITRAWSRPITRLHVHTCTLDSPGALDFYRRSGFVPTHQQIEIADDPRLTGKLSASAGPHVPMFPVG